MDTRTDPGQYYPGGRVMVRPDVAPPQIEVNVSWSDIKNKPDFSDIAALGAADSVGNVKTAVNKIVDKMNTAIIVLLCGLCAVLSAPAATALNDLSGTNEVYTAAETDAAIVRLAPAPGNYAAVSNAAMSAASHTDAATNALRQALVGGDITVYDAVSASWATSAGTAMTAAGLGANGNTRTDADIFAQIDAASQTNALQDAAIAGKASTNDVQLVPVHSEWEMSGIPNGATGITGPTFYDSFGVGWEVYFHYNGKVYSGSMSAGLYATELSLTCEALDVATTIEVVATRKLIGYTLGLQTDKVLASTNHESGVSASAVTNIVHDLSLGGIWDSQLEVWWTPRMRNGSLTYEATTNVNLNAGN